LAEIQELKIWQADDGIITQDGFLGEPDEEALGNYNRDFNRQWKEHWYKYFSEMFTKVGLFRELEWAQKELRRTQKERDVFADKIKGLLIANEELLAANIEKEEENESLRGELRALRQKVGDTSGGILGLTGKLLKKNMQNYNLKEKNLELKKIAENPLNKTPDSKVDEILLLKAKGLKVSEIATKVGVAPATVSRYTAKNAKRLKELEHSLKS